jgi:hypothetical protein
MILKASRQPLGKPFRCHSLSGASVMPR